CPVRVVRRDGKPCGWGGKDKTRGTRVTDVGHKRGPLMRLPSRTPKFQRLTSSDLNSQRRPCVQPRARRHGIDGIAGFGSYVAAYRDTLAPPGRTTSEVYSANRGSSLSVRKQLLARRAAHGHSPALGCSDDGDRVSGDRCRLPRRLHISESENAM